MTESGKTKRRMAAMQASRGLKTKDIAANLGVSPSTISAWRKEAGFALAKDEYDRLADAQLQRLDAHNILLAQKAQQLLAKRLEENPNNVKDRVLLELVAQPLKHRAEPKAPTNNYINIFKEESRASRTDTGRIIEATVSSESTGESDTVASKVQS